MSKPGLRKQFIDFIESQQMFFVATAATDGHVNVSPKGLDSLRILSPERLVWLNLSGSGNETAAHVQEVNRITLMFCAFEGKPLIVSVYGTATVIHPWDAAWQEFIDMFPVMAGSRQIFDIEVEFAQASCGSGVPYYEFKGQRGIGELLPFYDEMGEDGVQQFWERKNQRSIDGKATKIFAED